MSANIKTQLSLNVFTLIAKVHSVIHIYKNGMEYSCTIRNNASLDVLYRELTMSANPTTMDSFVDTYKSSIILMTYIPSKISFIEAYSTAIHLLLDEKSIRVIADIVLAACGLEHLWHIDAENCISYKNDYVVFETGGGVIEIIQTATSESGLEQEYKNSIVQLDDKEYICAYFKGVIAQILITEDIIKDIVLLDIIKTDINISIEINKQIRDFVCILNKATTIPTRSCSEFYVDNGDVFVYVDDIKLKLPMQESFGYIPDKIRILVDVSPYSVITFIVTDVLTVKECHYTLYELIRKNCLLEFHSMNFLSSKEQEYQDEYRACVEEDEEISPKERRLLNKLRLSLGISEERAREIENRNL